MLSRHNLYPLLLFLLTLNLFVTASPISDQWDSLRHLDKIDGQTRDWYWNRVYRRRCMVACMFVDHSTTTATTEVVVSTKSVALDEAPTPVPTVSGETTTTSGSSSSSPTGTLKSEATSLLSSSSTVVVTPTSGVTNAGQTSASLGTHVVSGQVAALSVVMFTFFVLAL
ncbi:hypothetical protein JAAARDRAFT_196256 [Jaapia argillacea MUCL 33604]|uniref:Uncharacterized protein n=1 Tax=Jaapia argillacea MUCL 33604 TaxID=933084 RepID=A0A067PIY3_9AGAM|nr:hypothetical protein JAAARDRAFT_196256 [Jaapia argillacea MUCL 33604]